MTRELSAHLSEEALNDVLIGMGSDESEIHLAVCAACRARVDEFHSDMDAFNRSSLASSEFASRQSPHPIVPRPRSQSLRVLSFGMAAAAALFLAMTTSLWHKTDHKIDQGSTNQVSFNQGAPHVDVPEDTEAQIAQDNELLKAVNAAISPEDESPFSEYHLLGRPQPHRKVRLQ